VQAAVVSVVADWVAVVTATVAWVVAARVVAATATAV
jgi:hypothetical protein